MDKSLNHFFSISPLDQDQTGLSFQENMISLFGNGTRKDHHIIEGQ
jgi:hypothetical protein